MRRVVRRVCMRVGCFVLAMFMSITPAFALVKEVPVYGAKSINDMGQSDHRVSLDDLKENYSDFVQTDTLREYFHKDQDAPQKVDLDAALSWLIDNNILSRDATVTVSNVGGNSIPKVDIAKFNVNELKAMNVTRTDLLMYVYKAAFGPINARSVGVETANVRVDDGQYITLQDLMVKNGYTIAAGNQLSGSGSTSVPGNLGSSGTGNGAGGGGASGSSQQTNYINDASNWRYQPQGDLWESIFGDTNIFISQNNFQQEIVGGNGGGGGGGGAGIGSGGSGGTTGNTVGNQTQVNTGNVGSIVGDGNRQENTDSNNVTGNGTPNAGTGGHSGSTGTGSGGMFSEGQGGQGGKGGDSNTGDNYIDYDTDYKSIYFIPGADLLFYETNEVPEVYIQAALSKGVLGFEKDLRSDEFTEKFVTWPQENPGKHRSWEKNSPAYVVNRSLNVLKTVSNTEQVATQLVLGKYWNISWQGSTLTLTRNRPFACESGYFKYEAVSKMDAYRYIYHFIYANEKVLSDLERDIVNYKYGMELDGIAEEEDTNIIKYLIAKGILNYDVSDEFMNLGSPLSWSELIPLLYRTANKDARYDFSKIQLTDSEAQWKARGYAPQTYHAVPGDYRHEVSVITLEEYESKNFGTQDITPVSRAAEGNSIEVVTQTGSDGRQFVRFGSTLENKTVIDHDAIIGDLACYGLTYTFEGAACNRLSDNDRLATPAGMTDQSIAARLGLSKVPTTYIGRYTMYLIYEMSKASKEQLEANLWSQYSSENPKHRLLKNVVRNFWVISELQNNSAALYDVRYVIGTAATRASAVDLRANFNAPDAYETALKGALLVFDALNVTDATKVKQFTFLFSNGTREDTKPDWVDHTKGDLITLVNELVGFEYTMHMADGRTQTFVFMVPTLDVGCIRVSGGSARDVVADADSLSVTQASVLAGANWSEAQKEAARKDYSNNAVSFATLESLASSPALLTYVDNDTKECMIAWSTIERYNNTCTDPDKKIPITKKSDYVLYNEVTQTYAYFSDKNGQKLALVGTDVVTGGETNGVVLREGTEVYYHIDALRLLMDARQEVAVLGGARSMPVASSTVQKNVSNIPLDTNVGANSQSLVGIRVLVSDDDATTKAALEEAGADNSVYYEGPTKSIGSGGAVWRFGDYIAVSQANRAINVISRQFTYEQNGVKQIAYAVVVFEPLSPNELESVTVDPTSSLQDLLDSPMKAPETTKGKQDWDENIKNCNAYANWIYQTHGQNYISTGYLKPHAYIYAATKEVRGAMSLGAWEPLTEGQKIEVEVVALKDITNGAVTKFTDSNFSWAVTYGRNDPDHRASYLLSTDYRVCVIGNRLYMHLGCFKNVVASNGTLKTTGITLGAAAFNVGSTFKVSKYSTPNSTIDGEAVPTITVVKTETDGTVTCQVGPVKGIPLIFNGNSDPIVIRNYAKSGDPSKRLEDFKWSTKEDNKLFYIYDAMFSNYSGISFEGIAKGPTLAVDSKRVYLFDGTSLWRMEGSSGNQAKDQIDYYFKDYMTSGKTLAGLKPGINSDSRMSNRTAISETNIETYFTIKFNAFNFTLDYGVLKSGSAQAGDYISPTLFTSLNDLIINEMINEDNGAIPIEEIPFGSLLEVGTGYYAATGTSTSDITFVGYAHLNVANDCLMSRATLADAATSFASHFIRAGNQQVNVSHFFRSISVLPDKGTEAQQSSLSIVVNSVLSEDPHPKWVVYGDKGSTGVAANDELYKGDSAEYTLYYAPVVIEFHPGQLMAYEVSAEGASPTVYRLVPNAVSSMSGALSDLPFFNANAMSGRLVDRTAGMYTGGFTRFYGATALMKSLESQFEKAFAGDLFTLARMVIFIVLIWLVVASWMCYATYFGGLMPILDAIRYPTGSRQGKGIDLMKIVSLGSITMETDFKLGRFLQYNAVLAALICVIWVTGVYL